MFATKRPVTAISEGTRRNANCVDRDAAFLINVDKVHRGGPRDARLELFKSRPAVRILIIKLHRPDVSVCGSTRSLAKTDAFSAISRTSM